MKLIGITSSKTENRTFANTSYANAFTRPNVMPVILPQFSIDNKEVVSQDEYAIIHKDHIDSIVDKLDGLVLSGGIDINPLSFDENNWASNGCDTERDMTEMALARAFLSTNKPIMGICRGYQLLFRILGADHFQQDLTHSDETHNGLDKDFKDRSESFHSIYLLGDLAAYFKNKTGQDFTQQSLKVNSYHHQGFTLTSNGTRPDGGKLKDRMTRTQYTNWLGDAINKYQQDNGINILGCTRLVIEAMEKPDVKAYGLQYHIEEYGNKSLGIQYWIDKYLTD